MTKGLWKNIRRSITGSLGRFLAIFCIIMLGVAFLTGLRLTRPTMIRTAQQYIDDSKLFDLRLLSTVGFDDEDVVSAKKVAGVLDAEGSYNADLVWIDAHDEERVLSGNAISSKLNVPVLESGTMPQKGNECLLDAERFTEEMIGQTVTVDDWGSAEESPFAYDSYTVTGLARTPLFMSVERGTSSLGDGSLDGFLLIPPEGFNSEYYTVLYVKAQGAFELYSDEYDAFIETFSDATEAEVTETVQTRFDGLVEDAREEIADGEKELREKRADAEAELADARKELDDAKAEIEDGETQLADGRRELADAKKELDDGAEQIESGASSWEDALDAGWAQYYGGQRELEDALAEAEQTLQDSLQQLQNGEGEYYNGQKELEDGRKQLEDGKAELASQAQQLADARAALEAGKAELASQAQQLTDARAALENGKAELESQAQQLDDARAALEDGKAAYETGKSQYDAALAALGKKEAELAAGEAAYDSALAAFNATYPATKAQLETGIANVSADLAALEPLKDDPDHAGQYADLAAQLQTLQGQLAALESGKAEIEAQGQALAEGRAALEAGKAELASNAAVLEASRATIEENEAQIAAGEAALAEGRKTLGENEAQLAAGETALAEGRKTLEENEAQLIAGEAALAEGQRTLEESEQTLLDGEKELQSARAELDDGWSQYRAGEEELENQRAEQTANLEDARASLETFADGIQSYRDGEKEIAENEEKLLDGKKEYEDGEREYADAVDDFDREIADAEQEIADAKQELDDLEDPELFVLDRGTNTGYMSFEGDSQIVENVSAVFPIFFFLIAALVCSTTMTRMVDDDRSQIGTMRALGYSRGAVLMKYLIYAGSAATAGCVAGYFFGGYVFPTVIWIAYGMLYSIPGFFNVWDLPLFLVSLAVSLLCSAGTAYLACRHEMKSTPADLIRPKMPQPGKRILLEHVTPVWKRLKFLHKVTLRNIFRFKKRMAMMILGIAGCTALVLTGFGLHDSVANIANFQFDDIQRYDLSVTTADPISEDFLSALDASHGPQIEAHAVSLMAAGDFTAGGMTKSVYIVASDDPAITQIVDLHRNGETVPYPGEGEILLTEKLAGMTGVGIGDTVELSLSDTQKAEFRVSGIAENYVMNYAYLTGATYAAAFGETYEPKTLLIRMAEGADEYALSAALTQRDDVAAVSVTTDTRRMIDNMMQSLNYVVGLVLASAGALAFVVLFNLGNINISERVREIATIKVLGFHRSETGAYVFRESLLLTVMGICIGLPLGVLLHAFVMDQIRVDLVSFKYTIAPVSYLLTVVLVLLFSLITDRILRRKIAKIDMAESLKSNE